jgi:hypothetical protein
MNSEEGQRLYRLRAGVEAAISQGVRGIAHNRAKLYAKRRVTPSKSLIFVRLPT